MKRRIIIILILTHAVLLVGGFYIGNIVSFQDAMTKANFVGSIGATGMFHEYLKDQLEHGSCPDATEALLSFDRMLKHFKDRDGALIGEKFSQFDRIVTYVRLANIAKKEGDGSAAEKYFSAAKMACEAGKWEDCSEKQLRDITTRLDSQISIKCLREAG